TGMLVGVDDEVVTLALRNGHRDDLLGERPGLLRGHGPLVGLHGQPVLLVPADTVLTTEVLGGLDPPAVDDVRASADGRASPAETVDQRDPVPADAPAGARGSVELHLAHRLDAAGDHEVHAAGGDLECAGDDRLESGAAAPVELHARHVD